MKLPSRLARFIRELRRRRVLQAAAVYATGAFVAVQVAAAVLPALPLPAWTHTLVVVVAVVGFPVVVALWWAFEITPEGIRRTVEREERAEVVQARGTPWVALVLVIVVTITSGALGWAAWGLWLEPGVATGTAGDTGSESTPSLVSTRVAVLPFDDGSLDGSLGRIASALSGDLIHHLDQVDALEVVSDQMTRPYADSALGSDRIARTLGAGSLVTGRVDNVGDSIRLRVQLVDGRTGENLMSREFTEPRDSLLVLRDDLVEEAVRQLKIRLGQELEFERTRAGTNDLRAWNLFYRAEDLVARGDSLRYQGGAEMASRLYGRADSLYREAREADDSWLAPTIARGWLSLKRARVGSPEIARTDPEWIWRGVELADELLANNPGTPAALELRGTLRSWLCQIQAVDSTQVVLERAEEDLLAALEQEFDRARAWAELAEVHRAQGEFQEARRAWNQAREVDAFLANYEDVPRLGAHLAMELGEIEEALRWARIGQEQYPSSATYPQLLLVAYTYPREQGPTIPADSIWRMLHTFEERLGGSAPYARIWVAAALARYEGLGDSARSVLEAALTDMPDVYGAFTAYYEPKVWLNLGDTARALERLREAVELHGWAREYVARDSYWSPLHGDSAFQELVAGTN